LFARMQRMQLITARPQPDKCFIFCALPCRARAGGAASAVV